MSTHQHEEVVTLGRVVFKNLCDPTYLDEMENSFTTNDIILSLSSITQINTIHIKDMEIILMKLLKRILYVMQNSRTKQWEKDKLRMTVSAYHKKYVSYLCPNILDRIDEIVNLSY